MKNLFLTNCSCPKCKKPFSSVTYQIVITETLQKVITVSADSLKEAQEKVKSMYNNSDIVLTADDHVDTEFRPY